MPHIHINTSGEIQMVLLGPNNDFGLQNIINENKRILGLLLERREKSGDDPILNKAIKQISEHAIRYFVLGNKAIIVNSLITNEDRSSHAESSFNLKRAIGRPSRFEQMMQRIDNRNEHAINEAVPVENFIDLNFDHHAQNLIAYIRGLSFTDSENDVAILLDEINEWSVLDTFIKDKNKANLRQMMIELGSIHGVNLHERADKIVDVASKVFLNGHSIYVKNRANVLNSVQARASNIPKICP